MFESPRSLQQVCIDFICGNVLGLCDIHLGDTNVHSPNTTGGTVSGKCLCKLVFIDLAELKQHKF